MLQNLILTARSPSKYLSAEKELARLLASKTKVAPLTTVLHFTSGLGLLALLALASMFFNPELANKFQAISPFNNETASNLETKIEKNLVDSSSHLPPPPLHKEIQYIKILTEVIKYKNKSLLNFRRLFNIAETQFPFRGGGA